MRVTDEERAALELLQRRGNGPRRLGPWVLWRALGGEAPAPALPKLALPELGAAAVPDQDQLPPRGERVVLDLCGGSGCWSKPYAEAGYDVRLITLPENDVRLYVPPPGVWGILAAPPCDQFSLARNGHDTPRDFVRGMECVNACLRVVHQCRASLRWWALENPVGHLSKWLGTPRDVWEPCDFGDPWTKRTAIWGDYAIPKRGPFAQALGGGPFCEECDPSRRSTVWCSNAAHRAKTPPGFARAFFEANQ